MDNVIRVYNDADLRETTAGKEMCDFAGNLLANNYPGYRWRIEPHPHPTKPFFDIILEAGHAHCAITVKPWLFYSISSLKAHILEKGGEFLERYHLNRRSLDEAEMLNRKRGPLGIILPDI